MVLQGEMQLRIWDVEHGACAMLHHELNGHAGRLAMIDSGCTDDWRPSTFIRRTLGRDRLDYLFITNADQDHIRSCGAGPGNPTELGSPALDFPLQHVAPASLVPASGE